MRQCIVHISKQYFFLLYVFSGELLIRECPLSHSSRQVDYAIKQIIDSLNEELICITEGKQNQEALGIMQNVMQLESSYHTNKRKRKASEAFKDDFDYLYGIVTTGEIFLTTVAQHMMS